MAKDYAKTKPKSYKQRSNQSSQSGEDTEGRLWALAGVLLVLFILGLFFLKHESTRLESSPIASNGTNQVKVVAKNVPPTTATSIAPPQPKFDFYTMLPGGQNDNGSSKTTATDSSAASSSTNSSNAANASSTDDNAQASSIPAPSSDFSDATLQQNSPTSAPNSSANSQTSAASDKPEPTASKSVASSDSTQALESTSSDASPSSSAATTQTPVKPASKTACSSPQQQVAALIKKQLDEESDHDSFSSQHGIINPQTSAYILQLGLFQDANAADQVRAQLVIQGLEAKVKSISKNNQTYYRIWMGPYDTKQEALHQQQSLKTNSVQSELIRQAN